MIINYLYIKGITSEPFEAYPPLCIDPDAVLSLSVSQKLFQPV